MTVSGISSKRKRILQYLIMSLLLLFMQRSIMSIVLLTIFKCYPWNEIHECLFFFLAPLLNKEVEKEVLVRVEFTSCRGQTTHWIYWRLTWE